MSSGTFLGRLSLALREQNWVAVLIEIGIVVLGIVIGFQVTAWGEEQMARAEERELLLGLRSEFEEVLVGIDAQVAKHRRVESSIQAILDTLAAAERAGRPYATVPDSTLRWAFVATTTQFGQGILSGMLGSGRLELIRDSELRSAVAEWEGVLADVTEDERDARDVMIRDLGPVLRRRVDLRPFQRYEHHLGTLSPAEAGTTSRLPVDLEVIGVFASQQFWLRHVIQEFEGPEAEAHRILALIDRALE